MTDSNTPTAPDNESGSAADVAPDVAERNVAATEGEPRPAGAEPSGVAPAAQADLPDPRGRTLSTFMKVSIGILTAVTLASIALLFIGDFQGKFERVFSTMSLFAVFVLLTGFDTRRERKNEWYAPVALIANAYILGLLLIVIWVTVYDPFSLQWSIMWKSVFVILTTRAVTFGMELLLKIGDGRPAALSRWGQITSLLGILSLIMFTAPVGIEAFRVDIPDLYWRFAVATLILTALGLAITLLLRWYYTSDDKPKRVTTAASPTQPHTQSAPGQPQPELLPWPLFADGTPYPADAHGQPDFATVQRMQQTQAAPPVSQQHPPLT